MKKKMRKFLLTLSAALLLVTMTVGVTVAYLTDTDAVKNTFTVGKVDLMLDEFDWDAATDTDTDDQRDYTYKDETGAEKTEKRDKNNKYHLMPGHTYTKDPLVTVLAGSEDAYVRVFVTVSNIGNIDDLFAARKATADTTDDLTIDMFVKGLAESWVPYGSKDADDTRTFELRYADIVKKATKTEEDEEGNEVVVPIDNELVKVFNNIVMPDSLTNEEIAMLAGTEITVVAEAIQAAGFETNAAGAWAALDAKYHAN